MTALIVIAASLAVGVLAGRWWALVVPVAGLAVFGALEPALGPAWGADTPIIPIALVTEASIVGGVILRRVLARTAT